jgi:CRP-like cAMP-binding protein
MDVVKELAKIAILRELSEEEIQKLAAMGETHDMGPGTNLLSEGNEVGDLWVILMGTVKVLKKSRDGEEEEIARLGTGSYLGELELARKEQNSAATVQTIEQTKVMTFARSAVLELCASDATLGYHLFKGIAGGLARRLAVTNDHTARYRSMAIKHR